MAQELTHAVSLAVLLDLGAGPGQVPSAVFHGTAVALLLLVWARITVDDARVTVSGDTSSARTMLALPLVP